MINAIWNLFKAVVEALIAIAFTVMIVGGFIGAIIAVAIRVVGVLV